MSYNVKYVLVQIKSLGIWDKLIIQGKESILLKLQKCYGEVMSQGVETLRNIGINIKKGDVGLHESN